VGRRSAAVGDPSRWVFNRLAEDYRHRPAYPEPLVARLAALAGPAGRVADLGAGTGHLALPLAARGLRVTAVEPAEAMLAALVARAPPGLIPVHASAEETGLPAASYDLVLVAEALHWLDPERAGREIGRLLAPAGAVAVVEAAPADTPFMAELHRILAAANPRRPPPSASRLRQLLALAGAVAGPPEPFASEALLAAEELDALLRSLSQVGPALGPAARERLLEEARALARRHGGARLERTLTLTPGRRRA